MALSFPTKKDEQRHGPKTWGFPKTRHPELVRFVNGQLFHMEPWYTLMFPAVDEPDDTLSTGNCAGPLVNISWMGVTIARWPGWSWCFFSRKRGAPSNVGLTHFRALEFGSPFDGSNSHQSDRHMEKLTPGFSDGAQVRHHFGLFVSSMEIACWSSYIFQKRAEQSPVPHTPGGVYPMVNKHRPWKWQIFSGN